MSAGDLLRNLHDLALLVLDRTGGLGALRRAGIPPAWALVGGGSAVLLLYGALASGRDGAVRTFRVLTLALALGLPLAALLLAGDPRVAGAALLGVLLSAVAHRALEGRRRPGAASRAIHALRLATELAGLVLLLVAGGLLATGRPVPLVLAFWALFLVRLSVAELLYPSRLVEELGLRRTALKELRSGVRRRRPSRALQGLARMALVLAWLVLPLLSALARGEVERGEWPRTALVLVAYPAAALALSSVYLVSRVPGLVREQPVEAFRRLLSGLATGAYLAFVFASPAFSTYRASLTGVVLLETAAGFLFASSPR